MVTRPTDIGQSLLRDLRERLGAPGLEFVEPPTRILGGAENWIFSLRLTGGPETLAGPLILRRYPPDRDVRGIRCEAAIQDALVEQDYPAPRVAFFCEDPAALGGAYLLMERIPGRVLLGEITRLPAVLGSPASALREFTVEGRLERMQERVAAARLDGLEPALAWLCEHYEEPSERVLCHADFHFLNLLVDGARLSGVVDWSSQHLAFEDPAYDVGNTCALFDIAVPGIPGWLRPPFEAVQRRLQRNFMKLYLRERPVDPERVRWAEVFRFVREMVHAGESLRRGECATLDFLSEGGNPWTIPEVQASALAGIERRTSLTVWLPEPA